MQFVSFVGPRHTLLTTFLATVAQTGLVFTLACSCNQITKQKKLANKNNRSNIQTLNCMDLGNNLLYLKDGFSEHVGHLYLS